MSKASIRNPVFHYYRHFSHDVVLSTSRSGKAKEVVLCVAKLFQKGQVSRIQLKGCHDFFRRGQGHTYEVHFRTGSRTLRRRFTAYRLNNVHAKSECYQVNDPHGHYLVVKIPPQPINDFETYLKAVVHERSLAERLLALGVKVVVPCVGAVMRHVYPLTDGQELSHSEVERRYLTLLRHSGDRYLDCFRVDGSFVFFLEFLDSPFLGRVVRDFYDQELLDSLQRQYFERDIKLMGERNRHSFIDQYHHGGSRRGLEMLFAGVRREFVEFCRQVDAVFTGCPLSVGIWQKQEWFLLRTFGERVDGEDFFREWQVEDVDPEPLAKQLCQVLQEPLAETGVIARYRQFLERQARWSAFRFGFPRMRKIGNKLLELLAALEKLGLVLRDLKVDNLFIVDEDMELGVIDLETGGDLSTGSFEGLVPAGMPSNMTLSNLLFVEQMRRLYGEAEVATILHLQDWYATISMLFESTIGMICFDEARQYILMLNREIDERFTRNYREFLAKNPGVKIDSTVIEGLFALPDEEIKGHTWQFWQLARRNLLSKCRDHKQQLREILYTLPSSLKSALIRGIERALIRAGENYQQQSLQSVSAEALRDPRTTLADLQYNLVLKEDLYDSKMATLAADDERRRRLGREIDIYRGCIAVREQEALLSARLRLLQRETINAFDLFPIMFEHVAAAMCRDEWRSCSKKCLHSVKLAKKGGARSASVSQAWKSTVIPTKEELAQRLLS